MGGSDLARLKSQLPSLPKPMREELAFQIQELEYRTTLSNEASAQQSARLRRANAEITTMLDAVGRTLADYQSLPPAQQGELARQADLVLANSRAALTVAHEETMRQIRSAPSPRRSHGFLEEFIDELTSGFLKGK